MLKKPDCDQRILNLMIEIKCIAEENNVDKNIIMQDFIHQMMIEFKKEFCFIDYKEDSKTS